MRDSEKVRNYVSTNEIQVRAYDVQELCEGVSATGRVQKNENRSDIAS